MELNEKFIIELVKKEVKVKLDIIMRELVGKVLDSDKLDDKIELILEDMIEDRVSEIADQVKDEICGDIDIEELERKIDECEDAIENIRNC